MGGPLSTCPPSSTGTPRRRASTPRSASRRRSEAVATGPASEYTQSMATVYVAHIPDRSGKVPANAIQGVIGKDTVPLIPVDIGNARLNLIEAAERAGVFVPRYCWHPALTVVASCRMCLVESGERK